MLHLSSNPALLTDCEPPAEQMKEVSFKVKNLLHLSKTTVPFLTKLVRKDTRTNEKTHSILKSGHFISRVPDSSMCNLNSAVMQEDEV